MKERPRQGEGDREKGSGKRSEKNTWGGRLREGERGRTAKNSKKVERRKEKEKIRVFFFPFSFGPVGFKGL